MAFHEVAILWQKGEVPQLIGVPVDRVQFRNLAFDAGLDKPHCPICVAACRVRVYRTDFISVLDYCLVEYSIREHCRCYRGFIGASLSGVTQATAGARRPPTGAFA